MRLNRQTSRCFQLALGVVLLATLGSSPTWAGQLDSGTSSDLAAANEALKNRKATIELASGSRIRKATEIEIGPEVTSFMNGKRREQVPTHEIVRIKAWAKHRGWKGFGIGAISGAVIGGVSTDSGGQDDTLEGFDPIGSISPGRAAIGGALLGGLMGAVVGKAVKSGRVIYEAPAEQRLASAATRPAVE